MIEKQLNSSGERVKFVRSILGLTRGSFEESTHISRNTLQAWENNKISLKSKSAMRLSNALTQLGLLCTEEWLINGIGSPPKFYREEEANLFEDLSHSVSITKEIAAFKSINRNSLVIMISDDSMLPIYNYGDFVGGIKCNNNFISLIGKNCIVETAEGYTLVRRLLKDEESENYILYCLNPLTCETPVLCNVTLKYAAPIVWHRKNE